MDINKRPKGNGVKCNVKGEAAEIFIYDVIDPFFGIGAKAFADDLKAMGNVKSINVRINSPGGDVFDGLAIFNLLDQHKAKVTVDIDGLAASIASIIAMVGSEIRIAANAMVMIHNAWTIALGNAEELRNTADVLDQIDGQLTGTYVRRTGNEESDVRAWMADETWFSADEAKDVNFVDSVTQPNSMAAKVRDFDLSRFRNTPDGILVPQPESPWSRLALKRKVDLIAKQTGIKLG